MRPSGSRSGFALLITITLVAFLVLVLVSLATLTRVETRVAANGQQLAQARSNALYALNLAVGQLQQHAGPDQAVTARADIDSANTGNPRWTGVWDAVPRDSAGAALTTPTHATAPSSNAPLAWLVSGNEQNGVALTPASAVVDDPADSNDNVWLLRTAFGRSLEADATNPVDGRIKLAKSAIKVAARDVPGMDASSTDPVRLGSYAWWVGDEGIKAKVNLTDPYRDASSTDEESAWRREAAPRPDLALLSKPEFSAVFQGTTDTFETRRRALVSAEQLPLLSTTLAAGDGLEQSARYSHDLTTVGYGVLADTMRGGLRRDLTRGLAGVPASGSLAESEVGDSIPVFTLPTPGPYGRTTVKPASAVWTPSDWSSGGTKNGEPHAPTWSTPRAWTTHRASTAGAMDPVDAPLVGTTINGVNCPVPDGHAIAPVIVMLEMAYGLDIDAVGNYRVMLRPRVVLMNPYNVTLNSASYSVLYQPFVTSKSFVYFALKHPTDSSKNTDARFLLSDLIDLGGSNVIAFNITDTFAPGEVKVFSLPASATTDILIDGTDSIVELESGLTTNRAYLETGKAAPSWYDPTLRSTIRLEQSSAPQDHPTISLAVGKAAAGSVPTPSNTARYIQTEASNYAKPHPAAFLDNDNDASTFDDNVSTGRQLRTVRFVLRNADMDLVTKGSFNMQYEGEIGGTLASDSISGTRFLIDNNPRAVVSQRIGGRDSVAHYTLESLKGSSYTDIDVDMAGSDTLGFWGGSVDAANGTTHAILFDVPRDGEELVSLGRLGQVNWGVDGKHPAYPLGNSFASIFYPAGSPDYGYALNEAIWDRFFFSTLPASLTTRPDHLPNSRLRFHDPDGGPSALTDLEGDKGYELAATRLMVDGAFNINSTSVEAWAAFLGSVQAADYRYRSQGGGARTDADVRPFPRLQNLHDADPASSGNSGNMYEWTGYRALDGARLKSLAAAIVDGIKRRGRPARSLAEFMNRDLSKPSTDVDNQMGLVQRAIDLTVNTDDPSSGGPGLSDLPGLNTGEVVSTAFTIADNPDAARGKLRSTGAPGFLLQGDLLAPLAPAMSARSDTFRVRAYGEARNPATGDVIGEAWCEAIVQRRPEYVGGEAPELSPVSLPPGSDSARFGREFVVTSFRWLSPDEI